jgi:hypothetical protein
MKLQYLLFLSVIFFGFISCSQEVGLDDYRIPFTGTYEVKKTTYNPYLPPVISYIEVRIDSSSEDKIYVNEDLIPISQSGTFGPGFLEANHFYDLMFWGDSIRLETYISIQNGIVAPCEFIGFKLP